MINTEKQNSSPSASHNQTAFCRWNHAEGNKEISAICMEPTCKERLMCPYCYSAPFHASHLQNCLPLSKLQDILGPTLQQIRKLNLNQYIISKENEFRSLKKTFDQHFRQFEIQFQQEIQKFQQYVEDIKNVEIIIQTGKYFEISNSIVNVIVDISKNFVTEQLHQKYQLPIQLHLDYLTQIVTNLHNKLKNVHVDTFFRQQCQNKKIYKFYSLNYMNYYQLPYNLNDVRGDIQNEILKKNGEIYYGELKNDKKHGRGLLMRKNNILEGVWENNQLIYGQKLISMKDKYYIGCGGMLDDKLNGKGYLLGENEVRMTGMFRNDMLEGHVVIISKDGVESEGEWKDQRLVMVIEEANDRKMKTVKINQSQDK